MWTFRAWRRACKVARSGAPSTSALLEAIPQIFLMRDTQAVRQLKAEVNEYLAKTNSREGNT